MGVLKKRNVRNKYNTSEQSIPPHICNINHVSSSGSMEVELSFILLEKKYKETNEHVIIQKIVTDDDTTMRCKCKNIRDGGKLPDAIHCPEFLADHGHRVKVKVRKVFAAFSKTKDITKIKYIDALRLKNYTACYISQAWKGDFTTFCRNAMAPVEDIFRNYAFCDVTCCWARDLDEQMHKIIV